MYIHLDKMKIAHSTKSNEMNFYNYGNDIHIFYWHRIIFIDLLSNRIFAKILCSVLLPIANVEYVIDE